MNQNTISKTGISVISLCLDKKVLQTLLTSMSIESAQNMIHNLNRLPSLSRFDCEASLIDFLDLVMHEPPLANYKQDGVEKFLYTMLSDVEAEQIIQEISIDKQQASNLLFTIEKGTVEVRDANHALVIISGIKKRLLDSNSSNAPIVFDHFTAQMIQKASLYIQEDVKRIANLIEKQIFSSLEKENHTFTAYRSGRKKTVIVLLQFNANTVSKLFKNLALVEKQAIAFEIKCLGKVSDLDTKKSLYSYMELMLNLKLVEEKQVDKVITLLSRLNTSLEIFTKIQEDPKDDLSFYEHDFLHDDKMEPFQELIQIAQNAVSQNPRLVSRAIRHMFWQKDAHA